MADPIHLSVDPSLHGELVTGTLVFKPGDAELTLELTVPAGLTTTEDVLPVLHGLDSLFAARGEAMVEAAGKTVSCRMGCGACCRQMVPITGAEARYLARLVAAMPEPRQARIRARFDAALATIDAAGMLETLPGSTTQRPTDNGYAYFRLGVACPFLENEVCSIYHDRPLICREYLVTSPPEICASPGHGGIEGVPLEWNVMPSLAQAEPEEGWMLLVLALRHAERPPALPPRYGGAILTAVIDTKRQPVATAEVTP